MSNIYLARMWRGEEKLWKAFWLWPFVNGLLIALTVLGLGEVTGQGYLAIAESPPYAVLMLAYSIWLAVAIWRCARNSKPIWRVLARFFQVLFVLGSAYGVYEAIIEPPSKDPFQRMLEASPLNAVPIAVCKGKFDDYYRQNKHDPDAYPAEREQYVIECVEEATKEFK